MALNKGFFITFEGGEGCGKSSQSKLLHFVLGKHSIKSILTREPGGTKGAEQIRELLVNGKIDKWDKITETLLYMAARNDHINKVILPQLKLGNIVISDRFFDSTLAYQGYGHGLDLNYIKNLHSLIFSNFEPELTFIFDIEPELGIARTQKRINSELMQENRYEKMASGFHHNVKKGFLEIFDNNPSRCVLINADDSIENIHNNICKIINLRYDLKLNPLIHGEIEQCLKANL